MYPINEIKTVYVLFAGIEGMKKYPLELETVPDFSSLINTFANGSTSPDVESVTIPLKVPFSWAILTDEKIPRRSMQNEINIRKKKLTEDTAARIRSLADLRGRNQAAAEATVVEALSFTDQEALGLAPIPEQDQTLLGLDTPYLKPPLVDIGAKDLDSLIAQLNGMRYWNNY